MKNVIVSAWASSGPSRRRPIVEKVLLGSCALILALKFVLIWRLNINWDEYFYLSQIHASAQGEISGVFQLAYVHLFGWLTSIGGNEIEQIAAGRVSMWVCLTLSVCLTAKLASRWISATACWLAPLAFLSFSPVLRHGASFRADSLLVLLSLIILVVLTSRSITMRRIVVAGAVFGFSLAISLKAVLLAPLFISLIFTDRLRGASRHSAWANWNIDRLMVFTASAAIFGITVLFFHWLTLSSVDPGAVGGFATGVARKTLFSGSLFPRWDYFSQTLDTDWLCWVYIFAGLPVAIFHSKRAALCLLALFPVVVYRNAFPYYYVVMLAPAAVLAALAIDTLTNWASKYSRASTLGWIPLAASMPLLLQTAINLSMLRSDGQELQRLTLAAVHKIFPEPVPYIDHSGMVSSFPKQNFFMSSWAIENYVAAGKGFMREAMASRPPLLLANSPFLSPGSPLFDLLLEEDRRLIENFYVNYWGAINIAGAAVDLNSAVDVIVELPFPGRYRLVADEDVLVDGSIREDGSIIEISENDEATQVTMRRLGGHLITAKLLWAGAGPEPPGYLPRLASLYSGL